MSKPPAKKVAVLDKPVVTVSGPEAAMAGVLGMFSPDALSKMVVEGFALAFERRMQGTSFEVLTESLQLAADLRLFKEGLFLTTEQVCRLLQISERTFERYKKTYQVEEDWHIGTQSPRYSFPAILKFREKRLLEASLKTKGTKAKVRPA